MRIGNRDFNMELKTYVMGILNLTPDSFSDGGQFFRAKREAGGGPVADGATQSIDPARTLDLALAQTERMIEEGADLIDIGGESTRPGYTPISDEEEIARVLPVIEAVKARFDIPVSLDTYKSAVAREGLAHGVDLINDIWGLKADPQMAPLIAEYGVPCCLMHNRKEPARVARNGANRTAGTSADGVDSATDIHADNEDGVPGATARDRTAQEDALVNLWLKEIAESLRLAAAAGIARERIILDPGIGFGKNYEQNLVALRHLDRLVALGYPVLLGASRKSVIANALAEPQNAGDCASCNACAASGAAPSNDSVCPVPGAASSNGSVCPVPGAAPADESAHPAPRDKPASCPAAATPAVPMEERVAATAVTTAFAVQAGCAFVRVHDVKENVQAIRMTRAILEG